jgi:chromosome segregation protein
VKRVIEREKGSTYYINNSAVRRRDVADLFLGTGLGGRAYAIIGQNTISRIVEAKPEELRVFLEEAAGISKYKERRRETELRLRDTRENLVRVEDICRELQKQITKLESQAVVTQQYHALQAALKLADGQLWLLKKRDASRSWELSKTKVEKLVNELEAQMASLRKSEAELELSRQTHYAASEGINTSQAAYYEANAEVANLENQVRQNLEARERMSQQLHQLATSLERNALNDKDLQNNLLQMQTELTAANEKESQANLALQALKLTLPEKESLLKAANEAAQKSQQALTEANQRVQIENTNINFLNQSIAENMQRIQRFEGDLSRLVLPDNAQITSQNEALLALQQSLSATDIAVQQLRNDEIKLQTDISQLRESQNQAQRALNQTDAEIHSLQKMQAGLSTQGQLGDWLASHGLKDNARLWQKIKIDDDWRVAIEAVLGTKLNALILDKNESGNRPPGALVLGYSVSGKQEDSKNNSSFTPLISVVKQCDSALLPILQDWLAGAYILASSDATKDAINKLNLGETLVNARGDIFSRHSIAYYGAENSSLHGVLERQQQLDALNQQQPTLKDALERVSASLIASESKLQLVRQQYQQENSNLRNLTNQQHQQQLALAQLQQARQTALDREKTIQADLAVTKTKLAQLTADKTSKEDAKQTISTQLTALETAKNNDFMQKQQAEQHYFVSRDAIQQAEKQHQETVFSVKLINNNINELKNKVEVNSQEKVAFLHKQSEAEKTLELTPMDNLKANLETAVNNKQSREADLANARNHLAEQEQKLQEQERIRMQNEQQLHPLRDGLEQSRLNEQEMRLHFEQCQAGLTENGQSEEELSTGLTDTTKTGDLLRKTNQLQQEIESLGAVNLAAIQELSTESGRKTYLDSQMLDLTQATETLEDAIKKIDRETRDKLMQTYNTVNGHFNELFGTLFGGGQAKLELLGDEILDTGLQVFAQPPGKKNTTIQMLSGGEKALTATALVFALFRLNPAPFCLMDEVDAPLDDSNTERFCQLVKKMSEKTQFMFVSHNKITMEMAQQLIGVTMQESGVSRIVDVDIDAAMQMQA